MIHLALKQAQHSTFKYRVGAVLVKSSRVLSVGWNVEGYSRLISRKPASTMLHAEQMVILKLLKERRFADLAGSTLYVARITKQERPALARPCVFCMALINAVGIKKVVYSE